MLHELGDQRIKNESDAALATPSQEGWIIFIFWNYAPPFGIGASYTAPPANPGPEKIFTVMLDHMNPNTSAQLWRLDADHGNILKTYDAMGRPAFPTRDQVAKLRLAGKASSPEQ